MRIPPCGSTLMVTIRNILCSLTYRDEVVLMWMTSSLIINTFKNYFQDHCNVQSLDSGIDYRKAGLPLGGEVYFVKIDGNANDRMDKLFQNMTRYEDGGEFTFIPAFIVLYSIHLWTICSFRFSSVSVSVCMRRISIVRGTKVVIHNHFHLKI